MKIISVDLKKTQLPKNYLRCIYEKINNILCQNIV